LMPFRKLLIANRGEIAVRIARACAELGIVSVAIYSDADRDALHVQSCNEAYLIGPAPASESYLRGDVIVEVARKAGCDALHPGYGFLSENAQFARAVIDAGITWVGPSPEAIALMGSKIEAKKIAQRAGVPVVPGYFGEEQGLDRLQEEARRVGFPVLIKASAGGGGKGMRVVESLDEMREQLEAAQREAAAAFGDDSVMVEKYLSEPRHIEVQVMGDNYGSVVHLGERECSVQRRHQKVVEESPSPVVTEELRDRITTSAVALASAAGYTNAGTVEFIYQDGEFYFLEMNTRLQVEHPVTEEALDIDLVEAQLRVAAGERLWFEQDDIEFKRHAIEARLYAEDPEHGFLPSTGTITKLEMPRDDEEIRVDAGIATGDTITPYYDPMIAKIITSGPTRPDALRRMREVLGGIVVQGARTNLDFLRWLVAHPQFEMGNLSTAFIEKYYRPGAFPIVPVPVLLAGAAVRLLSTDYDPADRLYAWRGPAWRLANVGLGAELIIEGHSYFVSLSRKRQGDVSWHVLAKQGDTVLYDDEVGLRLKNADVEEYDGRSSSVVQIGIPGEPLQSLEFSWGDVDDLFVVWDRREYRVRTAPELSTERMDKSIKLYGENSLQSPMPGKVLRVLVGEGEVVSAEQPLVIIEAMKMEFTVRAPHDGLVSSMKHHEGEQVAAGDVLVELESK
jgi:3-methylcrotonyl-CoA carboxylase alpha subunit